MSMSYKHAYKYFLSCEKVQLIGRKPSACLQGTGNKLILGVKRNKFHLETEWMIRAWDSRSQFHCLHSLTP